MPSRYRVVAGYAAGLVVFFFARPTLRSAAAAAALFALGEAVRLWASGHIEKTLRLATGGPYAYTREAYGDFPGFLIAWGYWISIWCSLPAIAVAFTGYLVEFLPAMRGNRPLVIAVTVLTSLEFWALVGVIAGIYTIFALGLQVQFGFTGLMNFGHVAFMAISAYTMAILVVKSGWSLWTASFAAVGAGIAFGVLIGLPSVRLRADYFAITTIAFAEIVRYVALNWGSLTGGSQGSIALAGPTTAASYNGTWVDFQTRVGDWLYLHGSTGSRPLRGAGADGGLPVCVTVTLVTPSSWSRRCTRPSMMSAFTGSSPDVGSS